jgi:predicted  nucleic acid-binding Zn-ribbon protein
MQVREKRNIQEQREKILETSTEIEELSKQKNAAEGVVSELREERNTLLAQLPQEWRTKYDRMLESVPDPIVAVVSNVCGSCFYAIVGKDLNQLRAGELLPCRSCYRILFMEPEKSSDEKSDG